jgi:phosphonate metabolism protein (transferase hexapeptide repeat family)
MDGAVLGENPWVDPTAVVRETTLGRWTSVGARTRIMESALGDYSYAMEDCDIIYTQMGKFCSVASHVRINPGNHPLWRAALHHFTYRSAAYGLTQDDDERFFQWRRVHRVVLGHDVWIGHGAVVLPGVRIGTGAAVGAGSVLTKDVPAFTVVAGVPARVIRRRFSPDVEASLMRIRWWDWSHKELAAAVEDFRSLDAAAFCSKYDPEEEKSDRPMDVTFAKPGCHQATSRW